MPWNVKKWIQKDIGLEFKYKLTSEVMDSSKLLFYFDVATIRDWIQAKPDGMDKWIIMRYLWRDQEKFDNPDQVSATLSIKWIKEHWKWINNVLSQDDKDQAQLIRDTWKESRI